MTVSRQSQSSRTRQSQGRVKVESKAGQGVKIELRQRQGRVKAESR